MPIRFRLLRRHDRHPGQQGPPEANARGAEPVAASCFGVMLAGALERQEMFAGLRAAEERVSLAADSAEAGHWILDCGTRAFWATEKAREIFAYSPNDRLTGVSIDITERRLAEEALRRIETRLAST